MGYLMLTDPDIEKLKREAMSPNYGSRYATWDQLLALIEAYEAVKAELEEVKGKDGQQELFGGQDGRAEEVRVLQE